jgi:ATP dependent DNA ligase domain
MNGHLDGDLAFAPYRRPIYRAQIADAEPLRRRRSLTMYARRAIRSSPTTRSQFRPGTRQDAGHIGNVLRGDGRRIPVISSGRWRIPQPSKKMQAALRSNLASSRLRWEFLFARHPPVVEPRVNASRDRSERGQLRLFSRSGYDRTALFGEPFRPFIEAGLPTVLDGEIAVPDDRGVTLLDSLSEAISDRRPERLAYFAFDLLHFDGHDLRHCPIEYRKMLLRDVLGSARCERIVYVDHVRGIGHELFEAVQQIGAEGIGSKRRGSMYRGGESREWLKTKCSETGVLRSPASVNSPKASSTLSMSPKRAMAFYAPPGRSGSS